MPRTRLLLVDLPRLVREIVEDAVSPFDQIELVGAVESSFLRESGPPGADFVVVGRDDIRFVGKLLAAEPSMKVLAIIGDGAQSALYELRPHRIPLGELSPQRLVEVITQSTAPAAAD